MSGQEMWDAAVAFAEALSAKVREVAEIKAKRRAEKRKARAAFLKSIGYKRPRKVKPKPEPEYEPTMAEMFARGCQCATCGYPPCAYCSGLYGRPEDYEEDETP